jgi:spermidine/putrescine transport system permease protein
MRQPITTGLATVYAALIYAFIFLPVVLLVLFSFQGSLIPVPPFNGPSLRWYEAVLGDRRLMAGLWNSTIVAVVSSALATLIGFLGAYACARLGFAGKGWIKAAITAPLAVSTLIIGMGLLVAANGLGISKSLWAVGLGHIVLNMPLAFAIIFSQMGDHQANIERAARDLGAAEWQVMALVTTPMLAPALFASFFLSMTFSWDEFIIAFLLTRFETTLPVEIWAMLRSGLSPKTNAIGSLVFLVSAVAVLAVEFLFLRRKPA